MVSTKSITHLFRIAGVIMVLTFLSACSSTLGNDLDVEQADFQIGVTHKSQVAEVLGLPNGITKDADKGLEYWGYSENPRLSELFVALPVAYDSGTLWTLEGFIPINGGQPSKSIVLVCVFKDDLLSELRMNSEGK